MIDSINFIIKKVNITNLNNNIIKYKSFNNKYEKNSYTKRGISFSYKNINFTYYNIANILVIQTNVHKILNKNNITLSDKNLYQNVLSTILNELIFNCNDFQIELNRIDYCVDLKLNEYVFSYIDLLNQFNTYSFRLYEEKKIL